MHMGILETLLITYNNSNIFIEYHLNWLVRLYVQVFYSYQIHWLAAPNASFIPANFPSLSKFFTEYKQCSHQTRLNSFRYETIYSNFTTSLVECTMVWFYYNKFSRVYHGLLTTSLAESHHCLGWKHVCSIKNETKN